MQLNKKNFALINFIIFVALILVVVVIPDTIINSKNGDDKSVVNKINNENTFVSSHIVYPDGSNIKIEDSFYVNFDESKFENMGITVEEAKKVFVTDFNIRFTLKVAKFKSDVEKATDKFGAEEIATIKNGVNAVVTEGEHSVEANLTFNSVYVMNLYINGINYEPDDSNESNSSNVETSKNLFIIKQQLAVSNLFKGEDGNLSSYYDTVRNFFVSNNLGTVNFIQMLGNEYTQYYSNADYVELTPNLKLHYWNVDETNLSEEFYFVKYYQNAVSWYVLAILVTLLLIGVLFLIKKFVSKKHANNN